MQRAALVAVFLLLLPTAQAADWPMFQGTHLHQGRSSSIDGAAEVWWTWTTLEGEHVDASPVAADGIVIIADRAGYVTALDLSSGRPLWQHEMGEPIYSTPAIALGRVFVASSGGLLVALDASDGRILAEANVGPTRAPLSVVEGKIYVGNEAGAMMSLTATTLDLLWQFDVSSASSASTFDNTTGITSCVPGTGHTARPIRTAAGVHAGVVVFASMNHHVYGVDEQGKPNGETDLMWHARTGDIILASPVVDSIGMRLFVAGYDELVRSYRLLPAGSGLDPCYGATNAPSWSYNVPGPVDSSKVFSSPAYDGNRLYFGANNGQIYAINAATGAEAWRIETGSPVLASPVVGSATVVVGGDDGVMRWLRADTGEVFAQFNMSAPVKTGAAVVDGTVIAVSEDGVVYRLGGPPPARPDLAVTAINASGSGATITVTNLGGAASGPTTMEVWDNGTLVETFDIPALEPGANVEVFYFALGAVGTLIIDAVIDPDKALVEESRENNRRSELLFIIDEDAEVVIPAPEGGIGWWAWALVGVTVLAGGGGGGFLLWRKRRSGDGDELYEDEEEPEAEAEVPPEPIDAEPQDIEDLGWLGQDLSDVDADEPQLPPEGNLLDEDL